MQIPYKDIDWSKVIQHVPAGGPGSVFHPKGTVIQLQPSGVLYILTDKGWEAVELT